MSKIKAHLGEVIYSMAKLSGLPLKEVAKRAGYTERNFYYLVKQRHLNTETVEVFAKVCEREIEISVLVK